MPLGKPIPEDVAREDESFVVTTEPTALHAVKSGLEAKGIVVAEAELAMVPKTTVRVEGRTAEQLLRLLEELEELDDVQKVHANFDIDADEMAKV